MGSGEWRVRCPQGFLTLALNHAATCFRSCTQSSFCADKQPSTARYLCGPLQEHTLIIEGSFSAASKNWRTAFARSLTGYSHLQAHKVRSCVKGPQVHLCFEPPSREGSGANRASAAGRQRPVQHHTRRQQQRLRQRRQRAAAQPGSTNRSTRSATTQGRTTRHRRAAGGLP